jgi:hypothetical protein
VHGEPSLLRGTHRLVAQNAPVAQSLVAAQLVVHAPVLH